LTNLFKENISFFLSKITKPLKFSFLCTLQFILMLCQLIA